MALFARTLMRPKELLKLTGIPVVIASLCCLSPVVVVIFGLGSVSFAASLADTLYGEYKWVFRAVGLVLLLAALIVYLRRKKICTLSDVQKHRREVLNTVLVALFAGIAGYVFFLYVVVHYIGVWLHIW